MTHEDEKFLRTGLTVYPVVVRGAEEFVSRMRLRLEAALKRQWPNGSTCGQLHSRTLDELYFEMRRSLTLQDGSPATLSAGIGWDSLDGRPYCFVYCLEGPDWATRPVAEEFDRDGSTSYIWKHIDPSKAAFDIDSGLDDVISASVSAAIPPVQGSGAKKKVSSRGRV